VNESLLEVKGLKKYFSISRGWRQEKASVRAVDGVSFSIKPGETLGLVGESGCGKTTVGRLLLKLIEPTEGEIFFEDSDLAMLDRNRMRPFRRSIQLIFQDPFASLNPRMTLGEIVGRPLKIHGLLRKNDRYEKICGLLEAVGLSQDHYGRYPHEFSGGQRQRIGIARALATNPKMVVADEPTSALDVSVQAQILNLLKDLQKQFGLTYLFISHNIGVIRHISDRVAVMYLGKIIEISGKTALFKSPAHPYTAALLAAVPSIIPRHQETVALLEGDVPSPINPPPGCRFHTRCGRVLPQCSKDEPPFFRIAEDRWVACHHYG
jgi:oligopeptide/dipeptide ABC transporter ATP-binding protein